MNGISKFLITPLSRESIARLVITPQASLVSGIDQVSVSRVASPFSGIARLVVSALSVLLVGLVLSVGSANAQNVNDFLINEKTASTGRVTLRSWPKGANTLWGTDANGLPQKIIIGSGLSLGSGSLIATGGSGIAISSVTGLQTALDDKQAASEVLSSLSASAASAYGIQLLEQVDADLARSHLGLGASGTVVFNFLDIGGLTTSGDISATGNITGAQILGNGASLTALNASELTTGTLPVARLPTTITGLSSVTSTTFVGALTGTASGNLVAGGSLGTPSSGLLTNCTSIPAAQLTGTINTARLPTTITGLTSVTSTTFVGALTGTASGNATLGANTFSGSQSLSSGRFSVNVLSTAASPAIGLTDSGATGFYSTSNGALYYGGTSRGAQFAWIANGLFRIGYSGTVGFCSGATDLAPDAFWGRLAANHLAQYNGTSAQRCFIANTYTSLTNNEVAVIDWQTTTNTLRLGTDKGSGGGSNRALQIVMGGTVKITLQTDGNVLLHGLPTSAPATSNAIWRDDANGGVLKQVP